MVLPWVYSELCIMENNPTTYNNIPQRIDEILSELRVIKSMVNNHIEKPDNIPKYLNIDETVRYLNKQGISISKSTLYKRSASGLIPTHKIENRLYFNPVELLKILTDEKKSTV